MQTTLVCTGQPANQPTNHQPPVWYVSIRVTVGHDEWDRVYECIKDCLWYISYPHTGSNSDNEHFHIFVPGANNADREKFRKRFKSAGFSGNKQFSIKLNQNCVTSAIQYASKEGTTPRFSGDEQSEWIAMSPEWENRTTKGIKPKPRKIDPLGIRLSCVNLLQLSFKYHQSKRMTTDHLGKVMEFMLNDGYYMDSNLVRSGAPDFYLQVFKDSVECGSLRWKSETITPSIFRTPRQTW